jgi:hypothetical protein
MLLAMLTVQLEKGPISNNPICPFQNTVPDLVAANSLVYYCTVSLPMSKPVILSGMFPLIIQTGASPLGGDDIMWSNTSSILPPYAESAFSTHGKCSLSITELPIVKP